MSEQHTAHKNTLGELLNDAIARTSVLNPKAWRELLDVSQDTLQSWFEGRTLPSPLELGVVERTIYERHKKIPTNVVPRFRILLRLSIADVTPLAEKIKEMYPFAEIFSDYIDSPVLERAWEELLRDENLAPIDRSTAIRKIAKKCRTIPD